jgi:hypothetical protein
VARSGLVRLSQPTYRARMRDPVERAYSQHAHQVIRGLETETFERALDLEDTRLHSEP